MGYKFKDKCEMDTIVENCFGKFGKDLFTNAGIEYVVAKLLAEKQYEKFKVIREINKYKSDFDKNLFKYMLKEIL